MVQIDTDAPVPEYEHYKVKTGGDYNITDLVEVYDARNPAITVSFQANYIVNGVNFGED